ncbi:undecaprenyldiphospho-muramoylpentapeptide beta-N-acetylglucosaminyltransferase [Pelagibacteraceae bacterium]|nr:undecaprenyldiphospho-muramoylpentapeptide beta-N-acetylglucosaminyltransferase [Pelagibacteraceae bacterium]
MTKSKKKFLIAAGGTGGHVFPALSLARNFMSKNYSTVIISDKRGLKFLENYKEIKLKIINTSSIFKKNPIMLFISFLKIIFSFFQSLIFIIKYKPNLVFGMGGYSSFPVCIAAYILRVPFIIYENNLVLGKTNKYLLPFSYKIFVSNNSLEGVKKKYLTKTIIVGNIIRQEILNYKNLNNQNDNNQLNILVLGGSQAAKIFAEKLPNIFFKCLEEKITLSIYQQCLPEQNEILKKKYISLGIKFNIFNFSHEIVNIFSKINLAITRSGSSMLAELLNCNIPLISIPLPSSAENHQYKNAKYLEEEGTGFLIQEQDIETELFLLIKSIHKDKYLLNEMKIKQKKYSDQKTFEKINKEIKEFINE